MIIRAPYPQVEIPEVPLTSFVLKRARELGNKPALIEAETGRTITYEELADSINQVAANLARQGFKKSDVLAILSPM